MNKILKNYNSKLKRNTISSYHRKIKHQNEEGVEVGFFFSRKRLNARTVEVLIIHVWVF